MQWKPGNSIQDGVRLGYFIVPMTKLKVEDSGFYSCGIYKSSEILTYRNIHLVVSPGEFFPFSVWFSAILNHKMLELERILM